METKQREIISPEGVEERLLKEIIFRVTLKGGGKYRAYAIFEDGDLPSMPAMSFDTKEKAMKHIAGVMVMLGGLIVEPEKTLDALFKLFEKRGE